MDDILVSSQVNINIPSLLDKDNLAETNCSECSGYKIKDGYIDTKELGLTEIPGSYCLKKDLFGSSLKLNSGVGDNRFILFRGPKTAYLIDEYGYSSPPDRSTISIVDLNGLDVGHIRQVGVTANPWFFTDGKKFVRVAYEPDGTGPCFEPPIARNMPSNIDVETFKVLGYGYSKDKNNVFYMESVVSTADLATFQILADDSGGFESPTVAIARDKNTLWSGSSKVIDILPTSAVKLFGSTDWHSHIYFFSINSLIYGYNWSQNTILRTNLPTDFNLSSNHSFKIECSNYLIYFVLPFEGGKKIQVASSSEADFDNFCVKED